jgi:hypothetical protein
VTERLQSVPGVVQRHFPSDSSEKWTFYSADLTSLDSLSTAFKQHRSRRSWTRRCPRKPSPACDRETAISSRGKQAGRRDSSEKWTFYSADLTSLDSLSTAFKQHAPTVVFHTAFG